MIFLRNYFVNTTKGLDVLTIIHEINRAISEAGAKEGLLTIVVPAPGGAVTIIEPLPDIVESFKKAIGMLHGDSDQTKNRRKEEIDIAPRVAAAMLGKTISIPIKDGKILLTPREEPVLIDLDKKGLRREIYIQITGGAEEAKSAVKVPPQMRR